MLEIEKREKTAQNKIWCA